MVTRLMHPILVVSFAAVVLSVSIPAQALGGPSLSHLLAASPAGDDTSILEVDVFGFDVFSLGLAGFSRVSGLAIEPDSGIVYGVGGDGPFSPDELFRIDPCDGSALPIGPTGLPQIRDLAFAPDGRLYGSGAQFAVAEGLVSLDPQTGSGKFVGFFVTRAFEPIIGFEGLAVHPLSNVMYATAGLPAAGSPCELYTVNSSTGEATSQGVLLEAGVGTPLSAKVSALTIDSVGRMFGVLGDGDGRLIGIDPFSATYSFVGAVVADTVSALVAVPSVAANLGLGLPGSGGITPDLDVSGSLAIGGLVRPALRRALPGSAALLAFSPNVGNLPLLGSTLLPGNPLTTALVVTGPEGGFCFTAEVGPGGAVVFVQALVADPGAVAGAAFSNGIMLSFSP